mgnify:CR=1 FL=1
MYKRQPKNTNKNPEIAEFWILGRRFVVSDLEHPLISAITEIQKLESTFVFMAEDMGLCSEPKNHKLKILNFLVSMRE